MISIGTRVKVTENYSGGLSNVVGKIGKVIYIDRAEQENVASRFVLDIQGGREHKTQSWHNRTEETYTLIYPVVVTSNEFEIVSYEFKDCEGTSVEIGDRVAYGPLGGGVIIGTVIDIDKGSYNRYGRSDEKTRVRVEVEDTTYTSDGGDRRIKMPYKRYQWYSHSGRIVVLRKNDPFTVSRRLTAIQ